MEYAVFSYFQIDPQSIPEWDICYRNNDYDKCKDFCDEKRKNGSLAEYYIYKNGEYPIGYLISHKIPINQGYLYHC